MTDQFDAKKPHTSLSSEPEEFGKPVEAGPSEDPSTGEGGEVAEHSGDVEAVAGLRRLEAAMAEEAAPDTSGLRDIAVASFGEPAEAVLGTDDRVQITNTSAYPWRAHASLLITAADGSSWIGTAWFIGPHTLATAGHCVYIKNSGVPGRDGWVRSIRVMPGRNGSTLPYGSATTSAFRTVTGWANNGDQNYDYGAIILPTDLGSTTGWFGIGIFSDSQLNSSTVNISGYPGDKPAGTQWYHANRVSAVNALKVFYTVDTAGGQSGSAVYRIENGSRYGVAVHAYGGSTSNSGTRINREVYDNLVRWKA